MMRQINLRVSEELLARVEVARGGVPREAWLRGAVEQALADDTQGARSAGRSSVHRTQVEPSPTGSASARGASEPPAPAEQPVYRQHVPGPDVENIRSSGQAKRDVRPVPKRGA